MTKDYTTDEELLQHISDEGVGWLHNQGYEWFWSDFIPRLEKAEASSDTDHELIADCYYVAGDVHHINDAPKAAIRCYLKSLEHDPDNGAPHREIASMYGQMGEYDKALHHSDQALYLNPNDRDAASDREGYVGKGRPDEPLNMPDDISWHAHELLAHRQPAMALELLQFTAQPLDLMVKAQCYGAMGHVTEYMGLWNNILQSEKSIMFGWDDWFFMPKNVYEAPDFWSLLLKHGCEYSGVFTYFDSLGTNEKYQCLSQNERTRLVIQYYVYAQSGNKAGLKKLLQEYPEWKELREEI